MQFSDEHLECMARVYLATDHHYAGTCRMGSRHDRMAVVDSSSLKVIGVKGLRVADASIMPEVTSGNTNAPAMMIGEKAADLILSSHSR